jgi:hypothetical protein
MTKSRLDEFISNVKTVGMARTNRFYVLMSPPTDDNWDTKRVAMLFCDQVNLPGTNFATTPSRTFGETRELPYDKTYDNLTMTFYIDRQMKVKALFDNWINSVRNPVTRTFNYYDDYTSNIMVFVQDLNDKTTYGIKLWECYPKTMSAVQMDNQSKDVMKLTVTFQYRYWEATTIAEVDSGKLTQTADLNSFTENFSGFQERINKSLGTLQNFVTGAVVQTGMKKFSALTSKIRF